MAASESPSCSFWKEAAEIKLSVPKSCGDTCKVGLELLFRHLLLSTVLDLTHQARILILNFWQEIESYWLNVEDYTRHSYFLIQDIYPFSSRKAIIYYLGSERNPVSPHQDFNFPASFEIQSLNVLIVWFSHPETVNFLNFHSPNTLEQRWTALIERFFWSDMSSDNGSPSSTKVIFLKLGICFEKRYHVFLNPPSLTAMMISLLLSWYLHKLQHRRFQKPSSGWKGFLASNSFSYSWKTTSNSGFLPIDLDFHQNLTSLYLFHQDSTDKWRPTDVL